MNEGGYNPLAYHNGSVWPHDNSLIVAGLARYGFAAEAAQVVDGLLDALGHSRDQRLPGLFAGYDRAQVGFPVAYPTAGCPQAWAAGSIFLLITAMLGIDLNKGSLRGTPFLPRRAQHLQIDRVWVDQRSRSIVVERTSAGTISRIIDGQPDLHSHDRKLETEND